MRAPPVASLGSSPSHLCTEYHRVIKCLQLNLVDSQQLTSLSSRRADNLQFRISCGTDTSLYLSSYQRLTSEIFRVGRFTNFLA
jgi:hypothetical protein